MNQKTFTLPLALAGACILALALYLLREFLPSFAWALLLSITTWPAFNVILNKMNGHRAGAAGISVALVTVCVILPIIWVASMVSGELHNAFGFLQKANADGLPVPPILEKIPVVGNYLKEYWAAQLAAPNQLLPLITDKLLPHASQLPLLLKNASMLMLHWGVQLFFAALTLFFVYLQGPSLASQARAIGLRVLGPASTQYVDMLPVTMRATVNGMVVVALGEGVVLGTAFWIAGIPNVVSAAIATAVMALIPGGAPMSFTLASLYLYGTGHPLSAIGLFSWGAFELFIVDHFIRPKLIGGVARLPFLVVLFGLLGGLTSFGLVGLFLGPTCTGAAYLMWKNLSALSTEENANGG